MHIQWPWLLISGAIITNALIINSFRVFSVIYSLAILYSVLFVCVRIYCFYALGCVVWCDVLSVWKTVWLFYDQFHYLKMKRKKHAFCWSDFHCVFFSKWIQFTSRTELMHLRSKQVHTGFSCLPIEKLHAEVLKLTRNDFVLFSFRQQI